MNTYGHFDDAAREYVITRPDTPLPWINYLGNNDFFGLISNTAGGYCFYRDAKLRRLTRYRYNNSPMDSNGRYLYVQDGDTLWSPSWKPVRATLDRYECRHGLGYSIITGEKAGIEIVTAFFVPLDQTLEIWSVRVRNLSKRKKRVRLWSYVEWCLWDAMDDMTNFQRNFSIGQVEVADSTIFHVTEYRERRDHYAYFHCTHPISGFDTSRDAFVGLHDGPDAPRAIIGAGACSNSIAHGWAPVGVHQIDLQLAPGQAIRFAFLLGYAENPKERKFERPFVVNKEQFEKARARFSSSTRVDKAFKELHAYWKRLLARFQVKTSNPHVNRMVNIWNQYQCMVTFNMSRSASLYESGIGRGMGYRDSNQDILGFVHMIPGRARGRILDIGATQLSDGTCYHQYQPLTKKGNTGLGSGFNDDPLWLIVSTAAYIKETGDLSILAERIGFADAPNSPATLLDHLEISLRYTLERRGPHGLPLIGHADWNDCLNLNCFSTQPGESFQLTGDGKASGAESVMIAGLFCYAAEELAGIYSLQGESAKAAAIRQQASAMRITMLQHAWDGAWFVRAFDASGNTIGSKECDEGKIFIESQAWSILGGILGEHALAALDSVKARLSTEVGIMMLQPAYTTYRLELGEITSYPMGYKENAAVFTHNNTWIQIAETLLRRGDRAFQYYMSVCPSAKEEQIDRYRAEPYVYSQMTAGKDAPTFGEAKNSWLTGTASWSFVAIANFLLGIRPGFNGLIIDPCIPRSWGGFTARRSFRGKEYRITVKKPRGADATVTSIFVDGSPIAEATIPPELGGAVVRVEVVMG